MSIRRIRAASAALVHTRTAALLAVPALVVGCLFAATAPAAYAAPDCTAATATTNIGIVIAEAGNLSFALGGLATTATPVEVQTYEQTAVTDLNTMSTDLNGDASYLQDCPSLDDADAQTVADADTNLANVTQQMLSTVIGKHSIFAQYGVTAPITASLRSLEAAFDSFTYALIGYAPTQSHEFTNDQSSVDQSLGNTISLYEQICIPSPLYPALQPICIGL